MKLSLAAIVFAGFLGSCRSASPSQGPPDPVSAEPSLRVMTLNLWQEGTSVDGGFDKIVDVIAAAGANLVVLTEVRNYDGADLHARLREALSARGHDYHAEFAGGDVGLLSRLPIRGHELLSEEAGVGTRAVAVYELEDLSGASLFVACAHLDYRNYALYLPRGYSSETFKLIDEDGDGLPDPVVDPEALHRADLASERDEAVRGLLAWAERHRGDDVLLAGDFNEASHLDWTERTKDAQEHHGVAIEWKNSAALMRAGFRDAYRAVHPDPLTHPGSTWPSTAFGKTTTAWIPLADERDRIDFVYFRSAVLLPRSASVVGPRTYHVKGQVIDPGNDDPFVHADLPWPTDHKGVLVEFVRAAAGQGHER